MPKSILTSYTFNAGGNTITNASAAVIPLTIKGAASQSANLLEIRNSSNTLLSYTLSNGDWVMPNLFNSYAGVGTGYSDYQGTATSLYVRPTATNRSGAVIKGLASQTADLLQMQDSSSVILAKIDSVGAFTTNSANGYSIAGAATFRSLNSGQTMLLTAGGSVSTNPHVVIRQSSSQTGDLTQWQTSTPTTVASISATGAFTATGLTTTAAVNLNYASPTIASNNASAASIFTGTVTGVTIGSSTIRTTAFPADAVAATSAASGGYVGMPQNSRSSAYTLVAADAGKHIYYTTTGQTVTIPANGSVAFQIGTTITFITAPSVSLSIAITTDTLRLANTTTTGTRTLAANGMATAVKVTSTAWIISGNGLT
jgi:hypothetical protein